VAPYDLYSSPHTGAPDAGNEKCLQNCGRENLKGREHLGNLEVARE
jgi:hypothetical protein